MGSDDKGKNIDPSSSSTSSQLGPSSGGHLAGYPPVYGPHQPEYAPGYGPGPHPLPGYHPGAYPYQQYAQPPPAAYYYQNGHRDPGASCCSCLLSLMISIIIFMCLSSFITWLLLHPEMPRFHVDNFSVTDFVANGSSFTGAWDAELRVENPNKKLRLHLERVQSGVAYDGELVSMTLLNPFFLSTRASTTIKVAMSTNNTLDGEVMQDMARDRKEGAVTFTLRLETITTFNSDWWTKRAYLRIVCEDLKVGFSAGSKSGSLIHKGTKDCLLYV